MDELPLKIPLFHRPTLSAECPDNPGGQPMIMEIRTYLLKTGCLAAFETRFAEAYDHRRRHSELFGFFRTEIGQLNEVTHIWPYPSLEARTRARQAARKEGHWPPDIGDLVVDQSVEVMSPYPFIPAVPDRRIGPLFELRRTRVRPGAHESLAHAWSRRPRSGNADVRLLAAGNIEFGHHNTILQIWGYETFEQRVRSRDEITALEDTAGDGQVLWQGSKICTASPFSPLQ
jgi:hypothetical protein